MSLQCTIIRTVIKAGLFLAAGLISLTSWAVQWSIYHGPFDQLNGAKEQEKYVRNISSLEIEIWKIRGDYFLLMGKFNDAQVARLALRDIQDSGYEDAFLQQRSLDNGQRITKDSRSEESVFISQEKTEVIAPLLGPSEDEINYVEEKEISPLLQKGWNELSYGNAESACQTFEKASKQARYKTLAYEGWSQCLQQQGKHEEAVEKLKWLVRQNYKPLKTLPRLIASLEVTGNLIEQYRYEQALIKEQEKAGIGHNQQIALHQQALTLIQMNKADELIALIDENQSRFRQCRSIEVLMDAAQFFRHHTKPSKSVNQERAARYYGQVLDACPNKWQLRVSVFESLATLLSADAFRQIVEREMTYADQPDGYQDRIRHSCTVNLMHLVYGLPKASLEKDLLIENVLAIEPKHWGARSAQAWTFYHRGEYDLALDWFNKLHKERKRNKEVAQGVYYSLVALNKSEAAKRFAIQNRLQKQLRESLERDLQTADDEQQPLIAKQILVLDKNHGWSLSILGWHHFRQGQSNKEAFKDSWDFFVRLTQITKYRKDKPAWEGRLLAIIATENWDGAYREINRSPFTGKEKSDWEHKARQAKAKSAFDAGRYGEAKSQIQSFENPLTEDIQLLAWCHHYLGDSEQALNTFVAEHQRMPSAGTAEGVLIMLQNTGRYKNYRTLMQRMMNSSDPQYQEVAGKTYIQQTPQIAAQYLPAPRAGYENWDSASAELHYIYSEQNGSRGADKFIRRIRSVWLHSPWYGRWNGALVVHDEHLTPGQIRDDNHGRDYLSGPTNDKWTQSHWNVQTPQLRGNYAAHDYRAHMIVGTTAQNAPVAPVPAWRLAIAWDTVRVDGFRIPRTDSMLAYAGMVDPYYGPNVSQSWGRVLDTGISGSKDWSLGGAHWLSVFGKASELEGFEVKANSERIVDLAYGMTDQRWGMTVTRGGLISYSQHAFDGDNYTHGHGGVYSPNENLTLGLLLNLESIPRSPLWWRLDGSVSYYQTSTEAGDLYPLADLPDTYGASDGDGVAYRIAGRWHYLWGRHFKWYGAGEWTVSGGYQFWQAMLGVQWYFEPRSSVGLPDAPMNIWDVRWSERP